MFSCFALLLQLLFGIHYVIIFLFGFSFSLHGGGGGGLVGVTVTDMMDG